VLVGHSIGAAIAVRIAAREPSWPLLGLAISGLGMTIAPGALDAQANLPATPFVEIPWELKAHQMFGPKGTLLDSAQEASRSAEAPMPTREVIDIVSTWPREARCYCP
jgi:pimeloyl-ACP methyl ester carboxylesterase